MSEQYMILQARVLRLEEDMKRLTAELLSKMDHVLQELYKLDQAPPDYQENVCECQCHSGSIMCNCACDQRDPG